MITIFLLSLQMLTKFKLLIPMSGRICENCVIQWLLGFKMTSQYMNGLILKLRHQVVKDAII